MITNQIYLMSHVEAFILIPAFSSFILCRAKAETKAFSVIFGGKNLGHLTAEITGDRTTVNYDYKNNGRGPTISEVIRNGAGDLPLEWSIKGAAD